MATATLIGRVRSKYPWGTTLVVQDANGEVARIRLKRKWRLIHHEVAPFEFDPGPLFGLERYIGVSGSAVQADYMALVGDAPLEGEPGFTEPVDTIPPDFADFHDFAF